MAGEVRVFAGIDWADEEHDVVAVSESGEVLDEFQVAHSGLGLRELCDRLTKLGDGEPRAVAVAIETSYGTIVDTLLERGFSVFSLNPKQLDRFRDRFTIAGAKDDRLDALVMGSCLHTDMKLFQKLEPDEPEIVELREWSRMANELVTERTRLTSQLREQLHRYYPQMLQLGVELHLDWFRELWRLLPTPSKAQKARKSTVTRFLRKHRVRRFDAEGLLEVLRQPELYLAPGAVEAAVAHIELLLERLFLVCRQHKKAGKTLEQMLHDYEQKLETKEQHDVAILLSLPGLGLIVLATLLAEARRPLGNRDYHALRGLTGVAPVTRRTGKKGKWKKWTVLMRRACNPRLRDAMHHWGSAAIQKDPWARSFYAELRQRGHSHGRAIRGLGDRLLKIACAMLRDGTMYDPSIKQLPAAQSARAA